MVDAPEISPDTTDTKSDLAAEVTADTGASDLEGLLAQYDAEKSKPDGTQIDSDEPRTDGAELESNALDSGVSLDEFRAMKTQQAEQNENIHLLAEYTDAVAEEKNHLDAVRDMDSAVASVRGEFDEEFFSDVMVRAWIDETTDGKPQYINAWNERKENPAQFRNAQSKLGREFHKKFSALPDKQATEDRELVAQAVTSASTREPPEKKPPNYNEMSDADFSKDIKKEFGYDTNLV